ncbi:MAG: hypothetical protein U1E65_21145 [Myxococcota bacterium]
MRTLLLAAFLGVFGLACTTEPPPPPKPNYAMQTPSYLTEAARQKLRALMGNHRESMTGLFNSLLVLDKEGANRYAAQLEALPRLVQDPKLPKDERIPERVIELQSELHQRAGELTALVNSPTAVKTGELASSFANLAKVCLSCHSHFLYPDQE